MRLRPNVALQQTGRLLMKRASRALLLIALQLNLGVREHPSNRRKVSLSYDRKRAARMVLALMYLDLHEDARAWKGYPWDVLDVLFEGGLITDPARKAKSVALTESGLAEAARCFQELLATESAVVDPPKRPAPKAAALPDIQRANIDALLGPMCQPHPDPHVASQVRCGYHVEGIAVVCTRAVPHT